MKIRTSELTSTALDWAVAKCEMAPLRVVTKGQRLERMDSDRHDPVFYSPSTDWAQGGPILERERVSTTIDHSGIWIAYIKWNYADDERYMHSGPTPLIAAIRCFVASKLGEEVEVPDEIA